MGKSKQSLVLAVLLGTAAIAAPAALADLRDHLRTVDGTVAAVDKEARTVTVEMGLGKEVVLKMDGETVIEGGELAVGQEVRIDATNKDGVRFAEKIEIKEGA